MLIPNLVNALEEANQGLVTYNGMHDDDYLFTMVVEREEEYHQYTLRVSQIIKDVFYFKVRGEHDNRLKYYGGMIYL